VAFLAGTEKALLAETEATLMAHGDFSFRSGADLVEGVGSSHLGIHNRHWTVTDDQKTADTHAWQWLESEPEQRLEPPIPYLGTYALLNHAFGAFRVGVSPCIALSPATCAANLGLESARLVPPPPCTRHHQSAVAK
jgi:hypothetical protein